MVSPTPDQLWQGVLAEAGAEQELVDFLAAKSIHRVPTFALLTKSAAEACTKIAEALITGACIGATDHKWTGDPDVLRAQVAHLWQECNNQWHVTQSQIQTQITAAATAAATATATALAGAPGTATASPASASKKVPKELPDGIWNQQIGKYNAVQVNGANRKFPEEALVGAEAVLARMWHEHTVTKVYTPTKLGEIVTARSFTATGEVNQLATKKDKTVTRLVDGAFEEQDPEIWDPKSAWALTDALEGIKWAMIFVDIGPEPAIETWIQYITKLVRTRPKYLAVVKAFFDHSSCRIANADEERHNVRGYH